MQGKIKTYNPDVQMGTVVAAGTTYKYSIHDLAGGSDPIVGRKVSFDALDEKATNISYIVVGRPWALIACLPVAILLLGTPIFDTLPEYVSSPEFTGWMLFEIALVGGVAGRIYYTQAKWRKWASPFLIIAIIAFLRMITTFVKYNQVAFYNM